MAAYGESVDDYLCTSHSLVAVQKGQLGLGDRKQRNMPSIVPGLADIPIVHGACGKCHTVVVAKDGKSYAWGLNAMGQCGTVEVKLWIRTL